MLRSTATISGIVRQEVVSATNNGVTSQCTFPERDDDPAIELRPCGGVGIIATNGDESFRTTSSSGDGSYLVTGLPPGTYSMSFERAGYSTVLFTATVAAGDVLDQRTIDLTMLPTGNLATGSVRLFVGSVANLPLTGITAQVLGQMDAPISVPTAGTGTTPVDLPGLLPGTYNVRITADEHDTALAQVQVPLGGVGQRRHGAAHPAGVDRRPRQRLPDAARPGCGRVRHARPDRPERGRPAGQPEGHPGRPRPGLPRRRPGRRRGAPVPAQRRQPGCRRRRPPGRVHPHRHERPLRLRPADAHRQVPRRSPR